jgi:hypothetical protein
MLRFELPRDSSQLVGKPEAMVRSVYGRLEISREVAAEAENNQFAFFA